MKRAPWFRIAIGVFVLAGAVAFAATRVSFLQGEIPGHAASGEQAPEFAGIKEWINTEPLTMRALRGKVVWIDFWTYSCINCIRTLPAVRAMYARYHPFGLEVVGVHSPEFDFEKSVANVRAAVERHDVPYPVAMDNDMATWRRYRNQYWPHVYLVDATGRIRFDEIGEGGDERLQEQVRLLLRESGARVPDPVSLGSELPGPGITPEIYAGYERGEPQRSLANRDGFARDATTTYDAPDERAVGLAGTAGSFFLAGRWTARAEYVEGAEDGARIVLPFRARKVFFVGAPAGPVARVRVLLDGKPATGDAGVIDVGREDLFGVLTLRTAETHVLTLEARKGFRLYTFTFG